MFTQVQLRIKKEIKQRLEDTKNMLIVDPNGVTVYKAHTGSMNQWYNFILERGLEKYEDDLKRWKEGKGYED